MGKGKLLTGQISQDAFIKVISQDAFIKVLEGLKRAAPYLRGEVGRRVRLRLTPELAFKADLGFDHAERISTLLRDADGR